MACRARDTRKTEARAALQAQLQLPATHASSKTLVVRINALDTAHAVADIRDGRPSAQQHIAAE